MSCACVCCPWSDQEQISLGVWRRSDVWTLCAGSFPSFFFVACFWSISGGRVVTLVECESNVRQSMTDDTMVGDTRLMAVSSSFDS
ncbi:hypothetical protein CGRA01v4_11883 [Colletotrichum graminicola]|nr:hypothetical protein CGRA01v4_11883 [Colletotrichum graminicola]